jgi:hypothetical protein
MPELHMLTCSGFSVAKKGCVLINVLSILNITAREAIFSQKKHVANEVYGITSAHLHI